MEADDATVKKVIESDKWDLIAVGGITTAYSSIKKIVKLSKKFSKSPNLSWRSVLTSIPKEVLTWLPEVDFGFVGEAYKTIIDVLSMIDEKI